MPKISIAVAEGKGASAQYLVFVRGFLDTQAFLVVGCHKDLCFAAFAYLLKVFSLVAHSGEVSSCRSFYRVDRIFPLRFRRSTMAFQSLSFCCFNLHFSLFGETLFRSLAV